MNEEFCAADASLAPLTLRRCADFTLRRFASRLLELAALELWNLLIFVVMTFAASMFF